MRLCVERTAPTVTTVRLDVPKVGWEQEFLLRSDAHHDNLHSDHVLEKRHLDDVKAKGAGVIDIGDLFCFMQGRWDKRADQRQLRPELRVSNYQDAVVAYNAAFYEPYAANFVLLSRGNHETAALKHHETDLTERLAERLKAKGSPVQVGSYAGWIRFLFTIHGTKRQSVTLRYTHGYGGGGPVTRDIIQAGNRQLAYITNADVFVSGHTHDAFILPIMREALTDSGRPVLRRAWIVKTGTYKDEYSGGDGWAVERGLPPKPSGACWLRFYLPRGSDEVRYDVRFAETW